MLLPSGKLTAVPMVAGATRLRAGNDFTCALDAAGLACWGDNLDGELAGAVATDLTSTPTKLDVAGATEIATGGDGDLDPNDPRGGHACALVAQGKVTCWGNNRHGQLGRAVSDKGTPAEIAGLAGAVEITAGAEITCARFESGAAACWGRNDHGQVGNGQMSDAVFSPVPIAWP
jgi:alpha-tubulin suppressor-like RCC1 family protein